MTTFADSSALVKLYADEPGHAEVRRLSGLVVSEIARVEVPAALWRKQRLGEISPQDAGVLVALFVADYAGTGPEAPRFAAVALGPVLLARAARLCATHALRAYDAVQLSSALAARSAIPACSAFIAYDTTLRTAAVREGFHLLPLTL